MLRPNELETPPQQEGFAAEEVRQALGRALASETFRHASRSRSLLRYLVEHSLGSEFNALREMAVGLAVFRRDPSSYDPNTDPIVRVEAARLRVRLASFYEHECTDARLRLTLPKGAYVFNWVDHPVAEHRPSSVTSIAVLTLTHSVSDERCKALASAIADTVNQAIERLPNARVVSRSSARKFDAKPATLRSMATQLRAQWLLQGSVQRSRGSITVAAHLSAAYDGYVAWSETFQCVDDADTEAAISALCDQIVTGALRAAGLLEMSGVLPRTLRPSLVARRATVPAAQRLYDEANALKRRASLDSLPRAVTALEHAIAIDPEFAAAHALFAQVHAQMGSMWLIESKQSYALTKRSAMRALELDPDCVSALTAMAAQDLLYTFDWASAEALLNRALVLSPNDFTAHSRSAQLLMARGRFDEAETRQRHACTLDPLNVSARRFLGIIFTDADRYDEAEQCFNEVLNGDANDAFTISCKAYVYFLRGEYVEAEVLMQQALNIAPDVDVLQLGYACISANLDAAAARKVVDKVLAAERPDHIHHTMVAQAWIALNEFDLAFEHLYLAARQRDQLLFGMCVDPGFRRLFGDARFAPFIAQIGLPYTEAEMAMLHARATRFLKCD